MGQKLNVYNLAEKGINVVKSPIHLEPGELRKAQNLHIDPNAVDGGVRKRNGLNELNGSAAAGSILGICNVPLNLIATRRFLIGVDQDITSAYQWITSTDAFSSSSTATTPAACSKPAGMDALFGSNVLTNRASQTEVLFLYPAEYTRGTPQPIRCWDGVADRELFKIPLNAEAVADAGLASYALRTGGVRQMLVVGTKLYLVSIDFNQPAGAGHYSRVMEFDFDTNVLRQVGQACSGWDGNVGASNAGGATGGNSLLFQSLAYHQGYLYAGVAPVGGGASSVEGGVYRIRPGVDSLWTYDFDNSANSEERPVCMASYKGLLYVGMSDLNTALSHVRVRSEAGAYTSSVSVGSAVGSGWTDMIVFGDNLYACAYDNNGAASITTIRKFDGTTWSTVKTIDTGIASPRVGIAMVVHNSRLYVLAINTSRNAVVTHTADGTTWVDFTTNLTNGNIASLFGVLAY